MQNKVINIHSFDDSLLEHIVSGEIEEGVFITAGTNLKIDARKKIYLLSGCPKGFPKGACFDYKIADLGEIDLSAALIAARELESDLKKGIETFAPMNRPRIPMAFSETSVKKAVADTKSAGVQLIFKDTSPGSQKMLMRVTENGTANYFIEYRLRKPNGKQTAVKNINVASANADTLERARAVAAEYREQIARNEPPTLVVGGRNRNHSLREVHEHRMKSVGKKYKESTLDYYKTIVNNLVKHGLFEREITSFDREEILDLHDKFIKVHGYNQADKLIGTIGTLIKYANATLKNKSNVYYDIVNPVMIMSTLGKWHKKKRSNKAFDKTYTKELIDAIRWMRTWTAPIDQDNPHRKYTKSTPINYVRYSYFCEFLLFTGLRPMDGARIRWSQVDTDKGIITWTDEEAEAYIKRFDRELLNDRLILELPISEQANNVLKEMKELGLNDYELVFPSTTGKPIKINDIAKNGLTKEKFGIYLAPGRFRHFFQNVAANVVNLKTFEIKRLVFHTQKHFDNHSGYIAYDLKHYRKCTQKVSDAILSLADYANKSDVTVSIRYDIAEKLMKYSNKDNAEDALQEAIEDLFLMRDNPELQFKSIITIKGRS